MPKHSSFYVYEHWRPDRDECFYVGKGAGIRLRAMARRNRHHLNIQAKLADAGMVVEVRMVAGGLTEKEAFQLERERISFWRSFGINLCNKTDGGEGTSGILVSAETRLKISRVWKGKKRPPMTEEQKKKISETRKARGIRSRLGAKLSDETREKIAASRRGKPGPNKGKPKSEETKRKISQSLMGIGAGEKNPFFGKSHSDETKRKLSEKNSGRNTGPSNHNWGRPRSKEVIEKIKETWAKKKCAKHCV